MKTWTMPRVAIEAFSANEYVSGCDDYVIPVSQSQLVDTYADLDGSTTYSDSEKVGTNTSRYFIGDYGSTPAVGLYKHVNFYKERTLSISPFEGDSYIEPFTSHGILGTARFNSVGTYTVYVYKTQSGGSLAYIYQDGYVPGGTPGESQAFS